MTRTGTKNEEKKTPRRRSIQNTMIISRHFHFNQFIVSVLFFRYDKYEMFEIYGARDNYYYCDRNAGVTLRHSTRARSVIMRFRNEPRQRQ